MPSNENRIRNTLTQVHRYAVALTGDPWLADDLVGEACIAAIRARATLDQWYLIKAVRSKYVDHIRRERRQRRLNEAVAHQQIAARNGQTDPHAHRGPDPGPIEEALNALRPQEREVLFLHVVAGVPVSRIMRITGKPRSTLLSLLQRGRRKLAERLEGRQLEV